MNNNNNIFLWRESYVDYLWATNVTLPVYFKQEGILVYESDQLSAYAPESEVKISSKIGMDLYNSGGYGNVFKKLRDIAVINKKILLQYTKYNLRKANNNELFRRYEILFQSMRDFVSLYRYTEPHYLLLLEKRLDILMKKIESNQERRAYLKAQWLSYPDAVKGKSLKHFIKFMEKLSRERFRAKSTDTMISNCAENLLEETARRTYLSMTQVSSLSREELETLLLNNIKPDISKVNLRKKGFVLHIIGDQHQEYFADDVDVFKRKMLPGLNPSLSIIKGATAYPGRIIGKAIVMPSLSTTEEYGEFISDFEEGSVLVAPMTSPELVPVFKKVVAIITDEGGITSHAALIAREMKIPCIVGTSFATKLIKTGMELSVDATKAQVKIVKI